MAYKKLLAIVAIIYMVLSVGQSRWALMPRRYLASDMPERRAAGMLTSSPEDSEDDAASIDHGYFKYPAGWEQQRMHWH